MIEQNLNLGIDYQEIVESEIIILKNANTTIAFVRYNEIAEVEYIFVSSPFRRKGIATYLIKKVEQLTNHKAVPQDPISPLGKKFFKLS